MCQNCDSCEIAEKVVICLPLLVTVITTFLMVSGNFFCKVVIVPNVLDGELPLSPLLVRTTPLLVTVISLMTMMTLTIYMNALLLVTVNFVYANQIFPEDVHHALENYSST